MAMVVVKLKPEKMVQSWNILKNGVASLFHFAFPRGFIGPSLYPLSIGCSFFPISICRI